MDSRGVARVLGLGWLCILWVRDERGTNQINKQRSGLGVIRPTE